MSVKANGTHAKDIALHFMKVTGVERATPAIFGRTIKQAKGLLESGYTKEEVIGVIDYIINQGRNMYSIGYVNACINDVLREIEKESLAEEAKRVKEVIHEEQSKARGAVTSDGESATRNAEKAGRLGVQSRLRKKFDFDMFEK